MDSLQQAKVEAICLTLTLALLFGMLPIKVRKFLLEQTRIPQKYTSIILSSCLCFGAGVLLATTFLHMLPENQTHIETLIANGIITVMVNYPLSELIMCLGFLFIYLTEELVHLWVHKHPVAGHGAHPCSVHHNTGFEPTDTLDFNSSGNITHNSYTADNVDSGHSHLHHVFSHQHDPGHSHQHHHGTSHQHDSGHSHQHHKGHSSKHQGNSHHNVDKENLSKDLKVYNSDLTREVEQRSLGRQISNAHEPGSYQQCFCDTQNCLSHGHDTERFVPVENDSSKKANDLEALVPQSDCFTTCELNLNVPFHASKKRCESSNTVAIITGCLDQQPSTCLKTVDDCHDLETKVDENRLVADNQIPSKNEGTLVRSVLVVLALSFHGSFEGLALGLERSVYGVWIFCLAICLHKVFIAFSIGMELLELKINFKLYVLHMTVFSLSTPLGATIGTILYAAIDENNNAGLTAMIVLEGLSAGTILYVTFCEVLERERTKVDGRFFKYLALVLGFGIMAGLQAVE